MLLPARGLPPASRTWRLADVAAILSDRRAPARTMLAFLQDVGWRESLVLVIVTAVFLGLRARKALYKR